MSSFIFNSFSELQDFAKKNENYSFTVACFRDGQEKPYYPLNSGTSLELALQDFESKWQNHLNEKFSLVDFVFKTENAIDILDNFDPENDDFDSLKEEVKAALNQKEGYYGDGDGMPSYPLNVDVSDMFAFREDVYMWEIVAVLDEND